VYSVYFDTGTTSTRAYLLEDFRLVASAQCAVGVRDSALAHSKRPLVEAVQSLYGKLVAGHGLFDDDVAHVVMSGMASSPDGLLEVRHLDVPVALATLREGLVPLRDASVLPHTIWLVPGIRALPRQDTPLAPEDAVHAQIMRGEETEVFGVRACREDDEAQLVALPGSHTQVTLVHGDVIVDLFSSVTGELRSAVVDRTILSSALLGEDPATLDPRFVALGYDTLKRSGFNHAIYALRTLELLSDATPAQRHAFFQGVLTGGVLDGVLDRLGRGDHSVRSLVVAGRRSEYDAYAAIAAVALPDLTVTHCSAGTVPLAVRGYQRIALDNELLAAR